jgi:hypothetical protein
MMKITKIGHGKFVVKKGNNMKRLRGGSKKNVINIKKDVGNIRIVMIDKESSVGK